MWSSSIVTTSRGAAQLWPCRPLLWSHGSTQFECGAISIRQTTPQNCWRLATSMEASHTLDHSPRNIILLKSVCRYVVRVVRYMQSTSSLHRSVVIHTILYCEQFGLDCRTVLLRTQCNFSWHWIIEVVMLWLWNRIHNTHHTHYTIWEWWHTWLQHNGNCTDGVLSGSRHGNALTSNHLEIRRTLLTLCHGIMFRQMKLSCLWMWQCMHHTWWHTWLQHIMGIVLMEWGVVETWGWPWTIQKLEELS
jgi:hypothetical protein